ncbi:MAG: hypothetical protein R3183_12740 [Oleiphilaceae bacterium]|nr:hypothetical protein [Oleiphilaceae bacterium]
MNKILVAIMLVAISVGLRAEPYSMEVNIGKQLASVDAAKFSPSAAEMRFAWYLQPKVALELYAGGGLNSDEDLDIEYRVKYSAGFGLRLESPRRNDTRAFAQLGYGVNEFELERSNNGQPVTDEFDGVTYGGGIEITPFRDKRLGLNVSFRRYYGDNGMELDVGSLGFRVVFE